MIAIILTAGLGNRMRPLTDRCHKTLLKVGEKEILGRIIDGLVENGVRRFVFVTGYRADEVEAYIRRGYPDFSATFVRNERYRETNNIFSMALAFEQIEIDEDILLIESDLIYDPKVIARILRSPHPNVALVDRFRTGMDGTVVALDGDTITSVIPSHQQGPKFDFSDKFKTLNIYRFSREFCNATFKKLLIYYASAIDSNCYYELVLGMLIYMQRETIHAEIVGGEKWAEVDDPNDLRGAEYVFYPEMRFDRLDRAFGGFWNYEVLDFGFIRNMYFPTPNIFSEIRNSLEPLLHSYCSNHGILREKLGYLTLSSPDRLNVLAGGCQAFPSLVTYFSERRIHLPRPTFGEYARLKGATSPYGDTGVDALLCLESRLQPGDVVVVVNPNNPTGSTVPSTFLHSLAHRNPSAFFLVDESFIDFADTCSLQSLLDARPLPNVAVLKSLSKALGVPGVRLGYTYSCCAEFNRHISDSLPIWQLSSVGEFLLEICLKHRRELTESFARTKENRFRMSEGLSSVTGIRSVFPSGANFLLVQLESGPSEAALLARRLAQESRIFVKNISGKFEDGGFLRLAVRKPEENARLAGEIGRLLGNS